MDINTEINHTHNTFVHNETILILKKPNNRSNQKESRPNNNLKRLSNVNQGPSHHRYIYLLYLIIYLNDKLKFSLNCIFSDSLEKYLK